MAETYTRRINIYVDSGQALAAQEVLLKKQDAVNASIKKYTDAGKEIPEKLTKQLNDVTQALDRQAQKIAGVLTPNQKELLATYQKTNAELSRMSKEDAGFEKKRGETIAAKKALDEYKTSLGTVATGWKDMLKNAGGVALGVLFAGGIEGAFSKVKDFFGAATDEALQAEEAAGRLKLALENYGKVDALDKLTEEAERLAKQLKYLDNDDIVSAQEKLVTYGKLSIEQIQELTPVIIDYAAKSKQSLGDATADIIKGLNGQGRELKNYGVELEKGGKVADNYGTIIEKLGPKVKGSADEFAKSAAGGFAIFKQTIANIEENLGLKILPFLNDLAHKVSDLIAPSETLTEQFEKQKSTVDKLESSMPALLTRYDELKGKTTLTKTEQDELKKIIDKVGEAIPTAISQFDKYGNALDINSTKAREFIQSQKDYLKYINQQAIEDQEKDLKDFTRQWSIASRDLERGYKEIQNRNGDMVKATLSPQQIKDLQAEVAKFQQQINGVNESLKKLRGDNIEVKKPDDSGAALTPGGGETAEEKAAREKADKEKLDAAKKYYDDLEKLREAYNLGTLDAFSKEIAAIRLHYSKVKEEVGANTLLSEKERDDIRKQYNELEGKEIEAVTAKYSEEFEKRSAKLLVEQKSQLEITKDTQAQVADIQLTAKESFLKGWSEMQKDLPLASKWVQVAQQSMNIVNSVFDSMKQREDEELAHDARVNEAKKNNLKKQLDAKKITQKQYDEAIHSMDKQADEKRKEISQKQFERNKAAQIITTVINTAAAVVSALGTSGNIYAGIALAAIAGATGAAQIAIIASQEPPEYGGGTEAWRSGIGGDKHSDASGGNPVIDPRTGKVIAKLEEKEAIIPGDSAQANQPLIHWMIRNRGQRFNVNRTMENIAYANGTSSFQQQWSKSSSAPTPSNNVGLNNIDVIEIMERHHKENLKALREAQEKPVVFSQYNYDTFRERNDFLFKRTSLG